MANLVPFIDWTPFFQTELKGRSRPRRPCGTGAAARQLHEDAQEMLKQIVDGRWFNPKAVVGLAGERRRRRHPSSTARAARGTRHLLRASSAAGQAGRPPQSLPVRFRRTGRDRLERLCRRLRRHGRHRRGPHRGAVRAGERRLPVDPREGAADRIAEAFAERMHQRPQGILGLRAGRGDLERRTDPGGIPGYPPGAGLSGSARPYGEGHAVSAFSKPSAVSA